jgi:hypothetical protein
MQLKLLGYLKTKSHTPAYQEEYNEHDSGYTNYALFFSNEDSKQFFVVNVNSSYGSCFSGYTGASWGNISQIKTISKIENNLVLAKKDVFIELLPENKLNVTFNTPKDSWDAEVETLLSTDNEVIATSTGNGGCQWYSSGTASINLELFL